MYSKKPLEYCTLDHSKLPEQRWKLLDRRGNPPEIFGNTKSFPLFFFFNSPTPSFSALVIFSSPVSFLFLFSIFFLVREILPFPLWLSHPSSPFSLPLRKMRQRKTRCAFQWRCLHHCLHSLAILVTENSKASATDASSIYAVCRYRVRSVWRRRPMRLEGASPSRPRRHSLRQAPHNLFQLLPSSWGAKTPQSSGLCFCSFAERQCHQHSMSDNI